PPFRSTRAISPPTHRALKAHHRGCGWPGCDRPINWTTPHHLEFWSRGGPTNLLNLLPLCYYHHRLVHEGGWQGLRVGEHVRFIPPDRVMARRARGPGLRWAAEGEPRRAAARRARSCITLIAHPVWPVAPAASRREDPRSKRSQS